jgi:microcystin-dependent protein
MKAKLFNLIFFLVLSHSLVQAQEPLLGEIRMFAGNFAPRGWAFCDGQMLQISQNSALFSLLGTTYGGDGRTTFALPDLRGRVPVHVGQGRGLAPVMLGQMGGTEIQNLNKRNFLKEKSAKTFEANTVTSSYSEVNSRDPYMGINYIIALQGTFPSRY